MTAGSACNSSNSCCFPPCLSLRYRSEVVLIATAIRSRSLQTWACWLIALRVDPRPDHDQLPRVI